MGAVLLQSSYGSRKTWEASNSVLVKEISDVRARTKQDRDTNGAHYFLVHWVKPSWNLLVCSLETTHSIFFRFWFRYLIAGPKSYQEITARLFRETGPKVPEVFSLVLRDAYPLFAWVTMQTWPQPDTTHEKFLIRMCTQMVTSEIRE